MKKIEGIKGIIFDYGGTLDTDAIHWSYILHDGFKHANINLSQIEFREAYVYAERELAKTPHIQPEDDFYALLKKKISIEIQYLIDKEIYPFQHSDVDNTVNEIALFCNNYVLKNIEKSRKVLDSLSAHYPLILVSNFYGNLKSVLNTYKLNYFKDIVESAVVGVRKPDPKIFQLGVEKFNLPAHQILVVGDSFNKDIIPANNVGCKTVWMKGKEWEEKEYDQNIPEAIIKSISELTNLL